MKTSKYLLLFALLSPVASVSACDDRDEVKSVFSMRMDEYKDAIRSGQEELAKKIMSDAHAEFDRTPKDANGRPIRW